jgi:hypothetical protein
VKPSIEAELKRIVETNIVTTEGAFAQLVKADFREGLAHQPTPNDRITYCRQWMQMYRAEHTPVKGAWN